MTSRNDLQAWCHKNKVCFLLKRQTSAHITPRTSEFITLCNDRHVWTDRNSLTGIDRHWVKRKFSKVFLHKLPPKCMTPYFSEGVRKIPRSKTITFNFTQWPQRKNKQNTAQLLLSKWQYILFESKHSGIRITCPREWLSKWCLHLQRYMVTKRKNQIFPFNFFDLHKRVPWISGLAKEFKKRKQVSFLTTM